MEEKIFMARVAEQAERFDDMVDFLKQVIDGKDKDFTTEERNLLSVGFKNLIGGKRTAIRTISAIEQNPKYKKFEAPLASYKKKIEGELFDQCLSIVKIVQDKCMKVAQDGESKAFFLKMVGDYYRYVAESADKEKMEEVKNGALEHYNQAMGICEKDLGACNPIRLGLALNFSVFHFEVMNDHKKACELGENALQQALEKIDDCDEETFRDAKSIIELLKENLSLWKEEEEGGNNGGLNKIFRNVAATSGKSEFDKILKNLRKSMSFVKQHWFNIGTDITESLRGSNPEVRPQEALNKMLARFLKNISSWALTTKMFIIFHRCLRDPQLTRVMAQELKQKEHLMHAFQKKASDSTYDAQMYADLSQMYANYIKFLVTFKNKSELLNVKMSEVSGKVKSIHTIDLLYNYENFDQLIQMIFGVFEHQNFCKKTRLWTNVVLQLFLDLIQIYKVFYVLITEVLDRFPELTKEQSEKFLVIYQNFVNFTKIMKSKGTQIQIEFGFHISLPKYYDPDPEMIDTLKVCIQEKERDSKAIKNASQQLRNGMNRNQFDTHATHNVAHRDTFFDNPTASAKQKMKEDESDSGEDFDYYDEEEDSSDTNKDKNVDFLNYISNMDLSSVQAEQKAKQQTVNADNFFNFDAPQTQTSSTNNQAQQKQQPTPSGNQSNSVDIFSLLETPSQNTQPNIPASSNQADNSSKDPFIFDVTKPMIPSQQTEQSYQNQGNQLDMFKNLYSNLPQQTIQPAQSQFQFNQQQQNPGMQMNNQFMGMGQGNNMMPNQFQSMNNQGFVTTQQQNMMGSQFGTSNMGMQQPNPMMQQQNQQNNQFISQQPFMSVQSNFSNMTEVQQQNPNSKEFTFW